MARAAWAASVYPAARRLAGSPDAHWLLTSSPPCSSHLLGLVLARRARLRWWVDLRDPWVGHDFRAPASPFHDRIHRVLEGRVLGGADVVTVASPGIQRRLAARYPAVLAAKVHVLPNGFDPEDFPAVPRPAGGPGLEILYAGTFDAPTPPDPFLAALGRVLAKGPETRERLTFRIMGGGDTDAGARIRAWFRRHGADGLVRYQPFTAHRHATSAMRSAHALALSLADGADWIYTSKVFEYLASGTPILAVVPDGDARDLLTRCGGATLFAPSDDAGLAVAIGRALDEGRFVPAIRRDPGATEAYALPRLAAKADGLLQLAGARGARATSPA